MIPESSPLDELPKTNAPLPRRKSKQSQERMMIMLTLFFIGGTALVVFVPEGNPAHGAAIGLYSIAVFWGFFKFCC